MDARIPDNRQISLVQETFAQVEPIAGDAARLFYERLFLTAPEVRPLFTTDLEAQGRALMGTLSVITRGLDDLGELLPAAAKLAERHVAYGVHPEHYQIVGAALLWTLEQGLGPAFTPDVAEAWSVTYDALAAAMIEAAYGESAA